MLKLIRLEWKKNNVGKYIRNVVIMSALICLFIFALCYLGIANDPDTGVPDAAPGNSAIYPLSSCLQAWLFWCLPVSCCPHTL